MEPDGRLVIKEPSDRRLLARIANPLDLGIQSEQAFKLKAAADHWDNTFTKAINLARQNGVETQTVGLLREAIDTPSPMGLTSQLENLIILTWAQATNHTFRLHGGPATPAVDRLDDTWEVVPQALPPQEVWDRAHERLATIFGVTLPSKHLSGFTVERAGIELRKVVDAHRAAVDALVEQVASMEALPWGSTRRPSPVWRRPGPAQVLLAAWLPLRTTWHGSSVLADAADSDIRAGAWQVHLRARRRSPVSSSAAQFSIIEAAIARPDGAHLEV